MRKKMKTSRKRHLKHIQVKSNMTEHDKKVKSVLEQMKDESYRVMRKLVYIIGWNTNLWKHSLRNINFHIREKLYEDFYSYFENVLITENGIMKFHDFCEKQNEVQKT